MLRGRVASARESDKGPEVLVDVAGVGYRVFVLPGELESLATGSEVDLHTHLHVREDDMSLYGFSTSDERDLFEALLGASGVGPKMAMSILATHRPRALRKAVATSDTGALALVPGIGKKRAEKLLLELRDRLSAPILESVSATGENSTGGELVAALAGLGYSADEIRNATSDLDPDLDLEEAIRSALRCLGERAREA